MEDNWVTITEEEALGQDQWEDITEEQAFGLTPIEPRGRIAEFGAALGRGGMTVGKGITGTLEALFRYKPPGGVSLGLQAAGISPEQAEENIAQLTEVTERISKAQERIPRTRAGAGGWAINVIGETIPYMAAALAGGYAVGPLGAAAVGFATEGQLAYEGAIKSGATEAEAQTERVIVGSINAAIEALQIGRLMKFQQTGKGSLRTFIQSARNRAWDKMRKQGVEFGAEILKTSVEEAVEEALQEGVSISVPGLTRKDLPRKPDGGVDVGAILERIGGAALGGGVAGAVLGGGGVAISGAIEAAPPSRARLESAAKKVQESKLGDFEKARQLQGIQELGGPEITRPTIKVGERLKARSNKSYRAIDKAEGVMGKDVSTSTGIQWYQGDGFLIEFAGKVGRQISHHPGVLRGDVTDLEIDRIYYEPEAFIPEAQNEFRTELKKLKQQFPNAEFVRIELEEDAEHYRVIPHNEFENLVAPYIISESIQRRLDTARKFETVLIDLETKRPELRATMKKRRGAKLRMMKEVFEDPTMVDPVIASRIARKTAEGYAREQIPELTEKISRDEVSDLMQAMRESNLPPTQLATLTRFFEDVMAGVQPHRSNIRAFDNFFGTNIIKKISKIPKKGISKVISIAAEPFNLLKAIVCSGDFSAGGIQSLMVLPRHPIIWGKGVSKGYRAFFSPEYVDLTEIEMQTNPYFKLIEEYAPNLITEIGNQTKGEEFFVSELAHRIPVVGGLVRASDRAFVTTLNNQRSNLFYQYMEQNPKATETEIKEMLDHIGNLTGRGRGKPGGKFEKYAPELGAVTWAPRLYLATVKSVSDIVTKPHIRKIIAGDLVAATGFLLGILALASLDPDNKVELDPRSSDFSKIKRGNTRVAFFGRHTQMIRSVAQLISGQKKAAQTGRIYSIKRLDVVKQFLRSKFAPITGIAADIIGGKTFIGKKTRWAEPEFLTEYVLDHITPMFIQDVKDAIKYQGWDTALRTSPLAIHGIGVQTYETRAAGESTNMKNKYAHQYFGVDWDELGPDIQQVLRDTKPMIDIWEDRARIEAENYVRDDYVIKEQAETGRKVFKSLSKDIQNEFGRLELPFGGLNRRISSEWFLNQERYKQYQNDTIKVINQTVPPLIQSAEWKTLDPMIQKEILDTVINECKKAVREKIIDEATIKDLERIDLKL